MTDDSPAASEAVVRLRPLVEDDFAMFRRFATEPGLIGLDWAGSATRRRWQGGSRRMESWARRTAGSWSTSEALRQAS